MPTVAEQPCPGSCNYRWREAQALYKQALADYDPLDAHQERPQPPQIRPVRGTPWCERDQAVIRRDLADLDDLAALLDAMSDGGRGQRPGAQMPKGKRHGGPSPSPTGDLLEQLAGDLREWESRVRGGVPLARRGYLATETTTMIAWLLSHFARAITMADLTTTPDGRAVPFAVKFGEGIRWWQKRLRAIAKAGTGTHHRPVRCPRCGELAVWWTEGDEHAVCHGKNNTCGRLIGLDELDALAAEQDRVRTTAAAGDSAEPAA